MKNLIIVAVLSVCLMACTSTTEKQHTENIDLVKSYVKAVEELDRKSVV